MKKNAKILLIVMFKNEASVIERMLDSTIPYIDHYVFQNNGSTDGTDKIVREYLIKHELTGEVYDIEEGWVGFGYNRDHVLQYAQNLDHGCDWIMKMDCDELMEVDDDFDWSLLDNKDAQAFHITAISGNCIYYRAWMWNANIKWAFNHDPCHETIYNTDPTVGDRFPRVDLPPSFRQIGFNEGQSWSNPYKFISDALILEEKMIRENTFAEDLYHFWYIAKSYIDAYPSNAFPLGESQRREFAKRAIYYFQEFLDHVNTNRIQNHPNEMAYAALLMKAETHRFLGEHDLALKDYQEAGGHVPQRNEHLVGMARIYEDIGDYDNMLACAELLKNPGRVCPFPTFTVFIDREAYYDTGTSIEELYNRAVGLATVERPLRVNSSSSKRMFIVDNFYSNPDAVRRFALAQEFTDDTRWYKGMRTTTTFRTPEIKRRFEAIIGEKIVDFEQGFNGVFQLMRAEDKQVYHYDTQKWAAMIYLTPDAPIESGTRLHRSKNNGTRHRDQPEADDAFRGNFYDSTQFDNCDIAGNIYNRLVIMDAGSFHSAGPYFGDCPENGRLSHLFFFD